MKAWTTFLALAIATVGAAAVAAQQLSADEQRALRARIEQRYDIVPLSDGIALRPKSATSGVRLIEISDDTIAVNGIPVSGRELRDRVGADADSILRLSYLSAADRRALMGAASGSIERQQGRPPEKEPPLESARPSTMENATHRAHRASGDRVRIFGDVTVRDDEEITGQVVAVIGSVHIDGEVGDQVVAVLGSVDLGPKAVVHGDVVSVGGVVRRAPGAQVLGGVTEIALGEPGLRVHLVPWFDGWGPFYLFDGFGAVPRLLGSTFRLLLLALAGCIAFVLVRPSVEASAQRVSDNPLKAILVGLTAAVLAAPVLLLTAIILAISIIGIPLLFLLPFAVLGLVLIALVGFTGTAYAVGQGTRRRLGIGAATGFADICLGVLIILLPLLVGRLFALAGWPATPVAVLLVAAGIGVEFLAWSAGFGAALTNGFARWRARRATRTQVPPAPQSSI